ncbi:hypothetical protein Slala04_42330 [Streptomyces lavendulae subsp. lavendulae]|nr:hypothetical protein Slala04_42330 [Streptomyces lavendulae subsp. lavendulae]
MTPTDLALPGRPTRRRRPAPVALTVAAAVVVLGGCGASAPRRDGARMAATAFEETLARADYVAACALLAPQTRQQLEQDSDKPCGSALADEELPVADPVRTTQVYGRQALLRLEGDTLFLSQFDDGWKIVAAGCEPVSGEPYRCALKGG